MPLELFIKLITIKVLNYSPVFTFQRIIFLSIPPKASINSSGENLKRKTSYYVPGNSILSNYIQSLQSCPILKSKSFTNPS
jgi:hypothetical protein